LRLQEVPLHVDDDQRRRGEVQVEVERLGRDGGVAHEEISFCAAVGLHG